LITLAEYKRLIIKGDHSERDLRKLWILREILDEYTEQRSLFTQEIVQTIEQLRKSTGDKDQALNYPIEVVNRHTGSKIREKRKGKQAVKNDFREIEWLED